MNTKSLTNEQWAQHYNPTMLDELVNSVRNNVLSYQTVEMEKITKSNQKVLEIGSGSGATSIYLALKNRKVTALDYAKPCIDLVRQASIRLNCKLNTVLADASRTLPFENDEFDVVFQAGLLEHFERAKRIKLLKLWSRVGKKIISIIPNAHSVAYRFGKAKMEKEGLWDYGLELPQYTLIQEFQDAGMRVIKEYSVGESHALNFLPKYHPLRLVLNYFLKNNNCGDNCGQGYLLVTIGEKYENIHRI